MDLRFAVRSSRWGGDASRYDHASQPGSGGVRARPHSCRSLLVVSYRCDALSRNPRAWFALLVSA